MTMAYTVNPFIIGKAITELTSNVTDIVKNVPGAGINFPYLVRIVGLFIVFSLISIIGQFIGLYLMSGVVQKSMYDLRNDISKKTNRIPVSYFDSQQLGDILSRTTNDVDTVSNALQQSIISGVNAASSIIFSFTMMLIIDWRLSFVAVIAIIISMISARFLINKSQPIFQKRQDALGDLFGFAQEQLSGFVEIKAYNRQEESIKEFKRENDIMFKYGKESSFLSSILQPISTFIFNLAYVLVVLLGGLKVIAGKLAVGNLQAFVAYVSQIIQPINMITQLTGIVQSAVASAQRIFDYLDEEEEYQVEVTETLPEDVKGHVVFENVKFGYSEDDILMNDVSFEVLPGQTAAIVGPTGAGKTTLINLLMRFYDVLDGEILIDGVNIQDISRNDLRKHLGMVLQDAWLFSDTVMENIRLGDLNAQDYEIRDAAQVANVDKFIHTLPEGYQMEINDEASNVSQGQKQLMTIARAVISNPDILILDEATSSVDTRLEHLIQGAMDKVMENRTSFVIAHRLSTIRDADIILVMKDGDIIESGTHDELINKKGFYEDLYNSQFNREDPADIHISY